jgi:hypothetical protein
MYCPSCGAPNAPAAEYCGNCGQALPNTAVKPAVKIWNRIGIVGGILAAVGFFLPWTDKFTGFEQFMAGVNFLTSGETGSTITMMQVYISIGLITVLLPAVLSLFALAGTRGTVLAMRLAAVLPLIAITTYFTVLVMWFDLTAADILAQHRVGIYLCVLGILWIIFTPDPRRNK